MEIVTLRTLTFFTPYREVMSCPIRVFFGLSPQKVANYFSKNPTSPQIIEKSKIRGRIFKMKVVNYFSKNPTSPQIIERRFLK
jgi:hypothetical protein